MGNTIGNWRLPRGFVLTREPDNRSLSPHSVKGEFPSPGVRHPQGIGQDG